MRTGFPFNTTVSIDIEFDLFWLAVNFATLNPWAIHWIWSQFRHILYHNLASGLMTANDTSQFHIS